MIESETILDPLICVVIKSDREWKLTQRRCQSSEGVLLHTVNRILHRGDPSTRKKARTEIHVVEFHTLLRNFRALEMETVGENLSHDRRGSQPLPNVRDFVTSTCFKVAHSNYVPRDNYIGDEIEND